MKRYVGHVTLLIVVAALAGCGQGPGPGLRGDGGDITGAVVQVDERGRLLTNIPFQWIAADPKDKGPSDWDKRAPYQGYDLKIIIGGREYEGVFACDGFGDTPWAAHEKNNVLRIDHATGNAAKESGAAVGTPVRLVKVGNP